MFGILEGTGSTVLDPRFHRIIPGSARVERLWTGSRWAEGPAWFRTHNTLVFSDIPNDRMLRFDEMRRADVSVFRQPAGNTNGNTVDPAGPAGHLRACAAGRVTPHRALTARSPCSPATWQGQAAELAQRSRW